MKNFISVFLVLSVLLIMRCGEEKKERETGIEKLNTPPFIKSAEIIPDAPILGSRVALRIDAGDQEGDKITYRVAWFLNDEEIGTGLEFQMTAAKKGDRIFAEITPSDGKLTGEALRTPIITIGNTPPRIASARISPDTVLTSTGNLTVIGEGIDPDGDSLTWLCYWVLDYSERIADSSTTIRLKNLRLKKGSHLTAELYAYDGDTVSHPYLLEIDVVNAHPILAEGLDSIPYKRDSIYFPVPIIDPDGDPITFEILESPEGLKIDKTKGVIYGSVEDTTAFEIVVRATDREGAYIDAKFTLEPPK